MQGFDERSDEIMDYMDNDRNLSAFKAAEHVYRAVHLLQRMSRKGAKERPLFQFPPSRVNAEDLKPRKKRTEIPALVKVQIGEGLKRGIPAGILAKDYNVV